MKRMPFQFEGETTLAPGPDCPVNCAMAIFGSRASILILRQAFYGDTRFEAFVAHTGISKVTIAKHLRELVAAGILQKSPYREPGTRIHHEYELTSIGEELLPTIVALHDWGYRNLPEANHSARIVGPDDQPVHVTVRSTDGTELLSDDLHLSDDCNNDTDPS